MSDAAISKAKEAEEKARLTVDEANKRRKGIIEDARSEAKQKYDEIINETQKVRSERSESSKNKAIEESKDLGQKTKMDNESIRNIDLDTVEGLVDKTVERIMS